MSGEEKCGLSSLLPMSCRGRAETFAQQLKSRLRSLSGSEDNYDDDNNEHNLQNESRRLQNGTSAATTADENSWLGIGLLTNHHGNHAGRLATTCCLSQPPRSSSGTFHGVFNGGDDPQPRETDEEEEEELSSPDSPEVVEERLINVKNGDVSDSSEYFDPINDTVDSSTDVNVVDDLFLDCSSSDVKSGDSNRCAVDFNPECVGEEDNDQTDDNNSDDVITQDSIISELSKASVTSDDLPQDQTDSYTNFIHIDNTAMTVECCPPSLDSPPHQPIRDPETTNNNHNNNNEIKTTATVTTTTNTTNETDEDDDEENQRIPRVRRCSSLRSGKTPPGTPGRKKIVRFADVLGLDLADVRTFLDEIPKVPTSAYHDLQDADLTPSSSAASYGVAKFPGAKILVPLFQQPGGQPNFLDRVRESGVCLENAVVEDPTEMSIRGTVRVRNFDFNKSVHLRYSLDSWQTFADVQGVYVDNSCDGFSDKFSFLMYAHTLQVGQKIEFAVRFHCKGCQYWDNNRGANYKFECLPSGNTFDAAASSVGHVTNVRDLVEMDRCGASFYY